MGAFFGREHELKRLEQLSGKGGVITLVGPPGVGKTRLAREHHARSKRGIIIELSNAESTADICVGIAGALGFMLPSIRAEAADEIGERLAARPAMVVVLDNFEQLVSRDAETIAGWATMAPNVLFLITSREPLGLEQEHVITLEPLPLPTGDGVSAATELFMACADRARADLDLSPPDRASVADICRSLDGLPLALELAAARLAVLDTGQLLERVRESLSLVSGGDSARHRSLSAAIELSWAGLSPSAQQALAQCSVFRGGFSASAAEQILLLDDRSILILDVLQELQRCSLLSSTSVPKVGLRCSMLLTVRGFAASKLGSEHQALLDRHTRYYASSGREHALAVERHGEAAAAAWIDAEQENLRAVYERAAAGKPDQAACDVELECLMALDPVLRSHDARLLGMLSTAVERATRIGFDEDSLIRARLLLGDHLRSRGQFDRSRAELQGVLDDLGETGTPHLRADCLLRLGSLHVNLEQFDLASDLYNRALAAADLANDRVIEGRVVTRLAAIAGMRGKHTECLDLYRRALVILRDEGDMLWLGRTHYWMGIEFLGVRQYPEARHYLQRAAELLSDARDYRFHAGVLLELGIAAQEDGDYDEAIKRYGRATAALRDCGERRGVSEALGFWASCYFEAGDHQQARAHFDEAIAVGREVQNDRHVALFAGYLAGLDAVEGHEQAARIGFDGAERLLTEMDAHDWLGTVQLLRALEATALSRVASLRGEIDVAREAHAKATQRLLRARETRGDRPALLDMSSEARISARIVEKALLGSSALARNADGDSVSASALVVTLSGTKLRAPGRDWTSLPKRSPMRRLLHTLVTRREQNPGGPVSLEELVESGWPGEKMVADAARNRAYMAISRLRKLGLKPLLLRSGEGYWLDPAIELIRIPEP